MLSRRPWLYWRAPGHGSTYQDQWSFEPPTEKPTNMIVAGLAYYRKEDWEMLLSISEDRDSMHDTWEDWHDAFLKAKENAEETGFEVKEVVIAPDALMEYCRKHGRRNDGNTRSAYAAELTQALEDQGGAVPGKAVFK